MSSVLLPVPDDLVDEVAARAAAMVMAVLAERPEYMGTREIAEYLGWPKKRIDNLAAARRIPFSKLDSRRVFVRQEIDSWVKQAAVPPSGDWRSHAN